MVLKTGLVFKSRRELRKQWLNDSNRSANADLGELTNPDNNVQLEDVLGWVFKLSTAIGVFYSFTHHLLKNDPASVQAWEDQTADSRTLINPRGEEYEFGIKDISGFNIRCDNYIDMMTRALDKLTVGRRFNALPIINLRIKNLRACILNAKTIKDNAMRELNRNMSRHSRAMDEIAYLEED